MGLEGGRKVSVMPRLRRPIGRRMTADWGEEGGAALRICSIAPFCSPLLFAPKPPPSSAPPRSLSHDVLALERIARLLSRKIWGQLKCEGATSLTSVWWAPVGAGLAWPLAVWVRRKLTNVYARKADKIY